jgi:hypothetical protein
MTLSQWVRQALRRAERDDSKLSSTELGRKLAVLDWATAVNLGPEADIEQMLAEIEAGYLADRSAEDSRAASAAEILSFDRRFDQIPGVTRLPGR